MNEFFFDDVENCLETKEKIIVHQDRKNIKEVLNNKVRGNEDGFE